MLNYLQATAANWPPSATSLLLALLAGGVLWFAHNALTKFDDHKILFTEGNVAYSVQRIALILAFGIAAQPALTRTNEDHPWYGLIDQAVKLAWVVIAILAVRYVVDLVILKANNDDELLTGNKALAAVEAGFYVGFGFILNGSLTGASPTLGQSIASTVVFGLLGLAVMIGVFWFHEAVTPWSIRTKIAEGKIVAGYEAGAVLASVGIVVREGVAGDFTTWAAGFVAFFWTTVFAVATLYLFRWLTNRLILRSWTLRQIQDDDRASAAAFSGALLLVVAISVAAVVRTQL
jgi:hypothetical protein